MFLEHLFDMFSSKKQTDIKHPKHYFKTKNKPIATKHRLQSLLPYHPLHHPTLPYNVLLYS